MASIEEKVEEHYKKILDELGIRHYGKTESINRTITDALRSADSKSGGSGNNYPDIQLLLENKTARRIPVMIEAKGLKNRLEKISKSGQIELITYYEKDSKRKDGTIQHHAGDANYSSIMNYAVNGAVHYANAILDSRGYTEVIAIGINGTQMNADGSVQDAECRAYYISEKNNRVPKHIPELDKEWSLLKADNLDRFFAMLDKMTLTEKELEDLRQRTETALETKIKSIHQSLYDDPKLRTALTTNEKLYLFCGLIMVGLTTKGVAPLDVNQFTGNDDQEDNDSTIIITRIRSFLKKKKCGDDKIRMILDLLQPVFKKETLWRPVNGESILKSLFKQVKQDIIPCLESNLHLDFTGKILNSLGDWVHIENDRENDVVLTPRYVTTLMAKLARTNMDSFVWDRAMGSAGFLVSAMDIMIKDAQAKIHDQKELEKKITNIKEHQLFNSISGRSCVRVLIEDYIMMKYLVKNESFHENIWRDYQLYGMGLYKLVLARHRENGALEESHFDEKYIEALVNEFKGEEFIDMDTKYFDKQNIRLKAEDVGEKNLYGLYYDYDSSFEHGLWGAIRESSLLKCNNPAHKYHCVPDVEDETRLKTVLPDCIMIMNKTISFLDEIYGIPEQLLNEVINFEIKPIAG